MSTDAGVCACGHAPGQNASTRGRRVCDTQEGNTVCLCTDYAEPAAELSARAVLVEGLAEHACCFTEEDAEKLVDAFAHELAEQLRASGRDDYCVGMDCCSQHGGVANLIDPQTQRTQEAAA
jgi:hypothetical protein